MGAPHQPTDENALAVHLRRHPGHRERGASAPSARGCCLLGETLDVNKLYQNDLYLNV